LPKADSRSREWRVEVRGAWEVGGMVVRVRMCCVERVFWRMLRRGVKSLRAVWYCGERGPCLW
jgi:hypothetical protein